MTLDLFHNYSAQTFQLLAENPDFITRYTGNIKCFKDHPRPSLSMLLCTFALAIEMHIIYKWQAGNGLGNLKMMVHSCIKL